MKLKAKILTIVLVLATLISIIGVFAIPASAADRIIYFKPGSNWSEAGAKFAAWAWKTGASGSWYYPTDIDADGVYEFSIPSERNNFNIMRMDPNASPNWSNNWGTSGDISIPADKNCLTISGWNTSRSWSNYSPTTPIYRVAGDTALVGANWNVTYDAAKMTDTDGDGTYTLVLKNVTAGTYGFKIAVNGTWDVAYGKDGGSDNASVTVAAGNCNVTISFTPATKSVSAKATSTHTPNADDGDCTTAITCKDCGATTTSAKTHSFTENTENFDHFRADGANCQTGDSYWFNCANANCTVKSDTLYYESTSSFGPHNVDTEKWVKTDTQHYHACTVDGCSHKEDVASHSGGTATCIAKKVCDDCEAEYGDLAAHSWSTTEWSHDVDGHWRACTIDGCTAISKDGTDAGLNQKAEHTWNGSSCACGEPKPACTHDYSITYEWAVDYSSCTATKICTKSCGMDPIEEKTTDISVVNTATCTAGGTKTYTATFGAEHGIAADTEEVASAALGHSFGATTKYKAATCLAAGNDAYKYCSQCELYYAGAAADNESTDNGKADTTSFVLTKLDHKYTGEIKSDGNGENATHSYKCVNGCGNYGGAVKHVYEGVVTDEPTCVETGVKTYTCTTDGCGATYTVELSATGNHTWENGECSVCESYMIVYFENNWMWPDAKYYYWGSTVGTNPAWNGIAFTENDKIGTTEAGYDIYMIIIPSDITGLLFNGTGSYGAEQSVDIKEFIPCAYYYMEYDSATDSKQAKTLDNPHFDSLTDDDHNCDGCGKEDLNDCTVTTWSPIDETTHSGVCTVCGETVVGDHSYTGNWQIGADNHWKDCDSCGYDGHVDVHSYTGDVQKDGTHHWQTCTCGDTNKVEHNYNKTVANETYKATDATCTSPASYYYSCECGAKGTSTFTSGVIADHVFVTHDAVAATCQAAGNAVYYTCENCSNYFTSNADPKTSGVSFESFKGLEDYYFPKLDHSYTGAIKDDGNGKHSFKCVNGCNEYGNATNHVYDQTVANDTYKVSDATCTAQAVYNKSCVCGAEGNKTFSAGENDPTNHSGEQVNGGTADVHTKWNCCGVTVSSNHEFGNWAPVVDTNTHKRTCSCGYSETAEHSFANYVYNENATCTEDGTETSTCVCGATDTRTKNSSKLGHEFDNYVAYKAPTCTEKGNKAYKQCTRCNIYFLSEAGNYTEGGVLGSALNTFDITASGHTFDEIGYDAPTCTEAGNEAHKKCTVCNLYFDTEATEDATDGSENNNEYIINAPGHKDENTDHVCDNNCGVPQGDHVDADKDHACDYGCSVAIGDHVDTNKDHVCDHGCSVKIGEHKDSATDNDHVCDYGCDEVLEECSDATGDGDHNCDVCGKENVSDHDWDNPTCTESSTCTDCGATSGDPMGHDFSEGIECKNGCGSKAVASIDGKYYLTLQEAFDAVENGETIVLARDFELSATAVAPAVKFTIDLNGKTVTSADDYALNSYNQSIICVTRGTDLTINDSIGDGCLDASELLIAINLTRYGDSDTGECAKLTVNAGKYLGGYYAIAGNGSRDNTYIEINDGQFIGDISAIYHPQEGTLVITGGSFVGNGAGGYGGDAIGFLSGSLEISGGTFEGKTLAAVSIENIGGTSGYQEIGTVSITGGTFISAEGYDSIISADEGGGRKISFISGGTFNTDLDLALLVDGLALKQDGESYTVVNAVAKIDGTGYGYASLADAVAAAQANDVIILLANDTVANTLNIGKSLTINTGAFDITSKADVAFNITASNVTFKLIGNVIVSDPDAVANARSGGVAVAQTVLTMDDVADVTAILDAEFELGAGDVIYSGPVDNISLSVRAAYEAALNKKGYVTKDSTTPGMVDVTAKSLYYIGDDGYWYFDDVKTGVLAKGENGESITITSYDKQPVKDGEFVVSHNYVITFSDGTEITINVPVARSIVNVEYNRTEDNKDIYVITYSDGSTSEFTVTNGTDGHSPVITIENGEWCIDGTPTGIKALGKDGKGIKSINKTTDGLVDTYTIIYTDDTEFKFTVTNGRGIVSISLTSTSADGLVDTYTITYNDGTTSTFTVTNGANGINGIQGEKGDDGHTPVITIQNGKWHIDGVDTGMQAQGVKGETGNGISDISKTGIDGLVDTYTITYTDGTKTTFTVTNGAQGAQGIQGIQGVPGKDGHTPVITIGENGNWFIDGADTGVKAEAIKGETGAPGADGEDGDTPYIGENGNWWIDGVDTGVKAEGKDGNDNNKIIILCIGIAALCIITTIVAVATKKFRRPWWILC